jgi:hypothetical protein
MVFLSHSSQTIIPPDSPQHKHLTGRKIAAASRRFDMAFRRENIQDRRGIN